MTDKKNVSYFNEDFIISKAFYDSAVNIFAKICYFLRYLNFQ
jgi:hypothetical protein